MDTLMDFVGELVDKLLSAEFPGCSELREQARGAQVRQIESHGAPAFLFDVLAGAPVARVLERVPVEGQALDRDGVTIHFLLHVLEGRLSEIEVFREDGQPIIKLPDIAVVSVVTNA